MGMASVSGWFVTLSVLACWPESYALSSDGVSQSAFVPSVFKVLPSMPRLIRNSGRGSIPGQFIGRILVMQNIAIGRRIADFQFDFRNQSIGYGIGLQLRPIGICIVRSSHHKSPSLPPLPDIFVSLALYAGSVIWSLAGMLLSTMIVAGESFVSVPATDTPFRLKEKHSEKVRSGAGDLADDHGCRRSRSQLEILSRQ